MTNPTGVLYTAGIVGHGVSEPAPWRTRPDLCPVFGHPGATYNTALNRTWCLCGAVQTPGDTAVPYIADRDGALSEWRCDDCDDYHDNGERCPRQARLSVLPEEEK